MNFDGKVEIENVLSSEDKASIINANLAAYIKTTRLQQRLTREDLAKQLKTTQYRIAKWENAEHDFTISDICKVASVLDIKDFFINLLNDKED